MRFDSGLPRRKSQPVHGLTERPGFVIDGGGGLGGSVAVGIDSHLTPSRRRCERQERSD